MDELRLRQLLVTLLVRGRLMPLLRSKPGIAVAKVRIWAIGVELCLGTRLEILLAMIVAMGTQALACKLVLSQPDGLHVRFGSIQHRRHVPIVLPVAERLRMHDDLMLGIDQRLAVVTLNDAMSGVHLRRLVIGDVTLQLLALLPALGLVRGQEGFNAGRLVVRQALELVLAPLLLSAPGGSASFPFPSIGSLMLG